MRNTLIAVAATTLSALAMAAGSAHADTIAWNQFAAPDGSGPSLSDGDKISLETQDNVGVPSDQMEIRLKTFPNMTWRKGIEVDRKARTCGWFACWTTDQFMYGMYLQDDDHGPTSRLVAVGDAHDPLGYGRLRFGKAKAFGIYANNVHTLYFDAAHVVGGRRYTFTWLTD